MGWVGARRGWWWVRYFPCKYGDESGCGLRPQTIPDHAVLVDNADARKQNAFEVFSITNLSAALYDVNIPLMLHYLSVPSPPFVSNPSIVGRCSGCAKDLLQHCGTQ